MYQNSRLRRSAQVTRKRRLPKWPFALLALALLVLVGSCIFVSRAGDHQPANGYQAPKKTSFNKQKYSLSDPTSPWVVVNKQRQLSPKTYAPANLTTPNMDATDDEQVNAPVAEALKTMTDQAKAEGVTLSLASGYRSYDTQVSVYQSEVKAYGQAQADRESARPGHSEHQSGWAADLAAASGKCRLQACFADTPEGKWLAANAHKYGFIIRYPKDKEAVTGYLYEPWHVRFVGIELSTEMHRTGTQTLEEFFSLSAAPSY